VDDDDRIAFDALLTQMVREGLVPEETVQAAADNCAAAGQDMAAHRLRLLIVQSAMSSPAAKRREKLDKLFPRPDGGNLG
jgi:hypothetical protein